MIDTSNVVFLDTETTGLYVDAGHEPYEIAYIIDGKEIVHWIKPDLSKADPIALKIGHFYERTADFPYAEGIKNERGQAWSLASYIAPAVARDLNGRHIVGAVPSFDDVMLKAFLRKNGQAPTWHYHLIDVEALIAGKLGVEPPWKSDELSLKIGVEPPNDEDRHTAIGDARWVKQMYEAVMG
jgi:hypothetical protein